MWREKAIKWAWITLALNAVIALMNVGFTYGHLVKHEYWTMGISTSLVMLNTWVAVWQYKSIVKYRNELKQLMWRTLSTPSEQLR